MNLDFKKETLMDDIQKFNEIKEKFDQLTNKKIRFEERLNSEKERLEKILSEIKAKGYDPKNLSGIKEQKESELKAKLAEFTQKLSEAEKIINSIEV